MTIRVRLAGTNQVSKRSARGGLYPSKQRPPALNLCGETSGRTATPNYFFGRATQIHDVRKVLAKPTLRRLASQIGAGVM